MSNYNFEVTIYQGLPLAPNRTGTLQLTIDGNRASGTLTLSHLDPIPLLGTAEQHDHVQVLTFIEKLPASDQQLVWIVSTDKTIQLAYVAGMCYFTNYPAILQGVMDVHQTEAPL